MHTDVVWLVIVIFPMVDVVYLNVVTCPLSIQTPGSVIPMTHAPDTGAINDLHFPGANFWYMYHTTNLAPDSSGTRFWRRLEHCSIESQKVACTWLKWSFMIYSFSTYLCRVSTTPGNPGNLLEFKNPPGNLLEFTGPPGNFCVRWSTTLVSGHKTGYQIAYLSRNWSPYSIFATAPCCIKCISCFCSIFTQTTSTG